VSEKGGKEGREKVDPMAMVPKVVSLGGKGPQKGKKRALFDGRGADAKHQQKKNQAIGG